MRVVADTNIVVSGLLWHGNPRRVLDAAREERINLYTSAALLAELGDVLGRERLAKRLKAASVGVSDLVFGYAALASVIEPVEIEPVVIVDPDDDAVIACAVAVGCEVIVSGDSDLLDLKQYKGIRIVTAAVLIAEIV